MTAPDQVAKTEFYPFAGGGHPHMIFAHNQTLEAQAHLRLGLRTLVVELPCPRELGEVNVNFEEAMSDAAKAADDGVALIMGDHQTGNLTDEDDISPALVGSLRTTFSNQIGGLTWSASIARHRKGVAAEEKRIGADIVIHVSLNTPTQKYSKGVLIQAKRLESNVLMSAGEQNNLHDQCNKMLLITPLAFVFNYMKGSMRCGSATRIAGAANRNLNSLCSWTSYRFFWELFRCPIGDERLTSALVSDLPIPLVLRLKGSGQLGD